MKVVWICRKCGKVEQTNVPSPYTYAILPPKHGHHIPPCVHDWYPVEVRRGI